MIIFQAHGFAVSTFLEHSGQASSLPKKKFDKTAHRIPNCVKEPCDICRVLHQIRSSQEPWPLFVPQEDDSHGLPSQMGCLNPYVQMRSLSGKNLSELFSRFDTNSPRIGPTKTRSIQRSTSQDPATQPGTDASKRVHIGGHQTYDDEHELPQGFDYGHADNILHSVEHLTEASTHSRNDLPFNSEGDDPSAFTNPNFTLIRTVV